MDLEDTGHTLADIASELEKPQGARATGDIRKLARADILVAREAFQWRLVGQEVVAKGNHVLKLAKAALDNPKGLPAIIVLPVGGKYYVLDGHHRLAAYDTAKWTKAIPARVFLGTLEEAHEMALKCNCRDKLAMTSREKSEAAWKLVKMNRHSKAEQAELTSAGLGTIGNMRRVRRELQADGGVLALKALRGSWAAALAHRQGWEPETDYDAGWIEQQADKLVATLLRKGVANMLASAQDEVLALVLEKLAANIPSRLMGQWVPEKRQELEALMEERQEDIRF